MLFDLLIWPVIWVARFGYIYLSVYGHTHPALFALAPILGCRRPSACGDQLDPPLSLRRARAHVSPVTGFTGFTGATANFVSYNEASTAPVVSFPVCFKPKAAFGGPLRK